MTQRIIFNDLNQVHSRLINDYKKGQAPQALLLSGLSGILKEEFAGYLAQILLCSSTKTLKPCSKCSACVQSQKRQHPNLLYLQAQEGSKSIKIEQLRSLLSALSLNPQESGRRVIVIINIETMTIQAQNALLKSLEEPQSSDYYILTSSNERLVLPTIISRCRLIRLLPWSQEQVKELLIHNNITPSRASEISQLSHGRPGLALNLEDDQKYWNAKDLAQNSFFKVRTVSDIPAASLALKDARDSAELLLNFLEQEAQAVLHQKYLHSQDSSQSPWSGASDKAIKKVLESVFEARKYKTSNVGWQSIADRLLFSITKEIYQCQWS